MKLDKRKIFLTSTILSIYIYFSIFSKSNNIENISVIKDSFYEPKNITDKDTNRIKNFSFINLDGDKINLTEYINDISLRLKSNLKENFSFKIKSKESYIYAEILNNNKLEKLYFENFQNNNVKGYAGKIFIGVFLSNTEKIEVVNYIISNETPSYLSDIKRKGFYDYFNNLSLKNSHSIDAISGATLTCVAISNSVNEIISNNTFIIDDYFSIKSNNFNIKTKLNKIWIFHIFIIILLFIISIFIKKTKQLKIYISIFSLLYLGFFLNNSFTYISFIHPFLGFSLSLYLGIYSFIVILSVIWSKNTYCKYICPFGCAQYLVFRISPFKPYKTKLISKNVIHYTRYLISIIIMFGFLMGMEKWKNYELFPDLFSLEFTNFYFFIALLIILISIKFPMIWCRLACPTGCFLDTISKISKNK